MNRRQTERPTQLSDYLHSDYRSRLMFQPLVPATPVQLARSSGNNKE